MVLGGVVVPGGVVIGGMVRGAMPVVAGGLTSLRAVLVELPLEKTSARTTMMNTAPPIHPHGIDVPVPVPASTSMRRSISRLRSKSRRSVIGNLHRVADSTTIMLGRRFPATSAVNLKFLSLWPQARLGTSNSKPH
jgi:hypothetical protein